MSEDFKNQALKYHQYPSAGKIAVTPTKSLSNQRDLALAYSPGVAYACEAIEVDPAQADNLTARSNLVAVITNGTAVLGLGNIGPLASKPVMEGKGVLFKKFAGIDVFDLEVNELDADKFVDIVASLEPTFGGINLEDIKAPECFYIEQKLRQRMNIPVFHDDQHGTAIIATAALLNALHIQQKTVDTVKVVTSGAGAAGLACLDLFVSLGVCKENITVCDSQGVIYQGREGADQGRKAEYAIDSQHRTLADALHGADVFLGVSKAGVLSGDMLKTMAANPLVLALANPTPEIMPEAAKAARPDVMIATGRSDYPNQVNNVLCFPYIFRGALDVGATEINEAMKLACVQAIADLARAPVDEEVLQAYGSQKITFGPDYIIPTPFDKRLIAAVPRAVAQAAMDSGVARRPITNLLDYERKLLSLQGKSGLVMKPIFSAAKQDKKRVLFAEGEESRVLRAVKTIVEEGIARPVLLGRPEAVEKNIAEIGCDLQVGRDFDLINPLANQHYEECVAYYYQKCARQGVDPHMARLHLNTRVSILAAVLVELGYADTLICGALSRFQDNFANVFSVLGCKAGALSPATLQISVTPRGTVFIADTSVCANPTVDELVSITELTINEVKKFGVVPRVAMLSHSNFGSRKGLAEVDKMARAAQILSERYPDLMIDGEMQADLALNTHSRNEIFPDNRLKENANVLIMPNLDAANIGFNLMKVVAEGVSIGPVMMGLGRPAYILTRNATVRRIVNMAAIAAVSAQEYLREAKPKF